MSRKDKEQYVTIRVLDDEGSMVDEQSIPLSSFEMEIIDSDNDRGMGTEYCHQLSYTDGDIEISKIIYEYPGNTFDSDESWEVVSGRVEIIDDNISYEEIFFENVEEEEE